MLTVEHGYRPRIRQSAGEWDRGTTLSQKWRPQTREIGHNLSANFLTKHISATGGVDADLQNPVFLLRKALRLLHLLHRSASPLLCVGGRVECMWLRKDANRS